MRKNRSGNHRLLNRSLAALWTGALSRAAGERRLHLINRIWAAIKRESLSVVEEGVAELEDIDRMFDLFTAQQPRHSA